MFVDHAPFDGTMPPNWTISTLGDVTEMGAGGDKPKESSPVKTPLCPYPIYSNGINDYGLYGYTNEPKIKVESVTVSARGTIGYVCLRHIPYVPIVRLVTLIPDTKVLSAKYLYLYLRQLHITGTGTTQQQLTVPDFRKTEIVIPDKNTMDAFTETVTPLFEQIWANEDENTKLAEVRDALLPKLMSGETDVSAVQLKAVKLSFIASLTSILLSMSARTEEIRFCVSASGISTSMFAKVSLVIVSKTDPCVILLSCDIQFFSK